MATSAFITTANGWAIGECRGPIKETIEGVIGGSDNLVDGDLLKITGVDDTSGILTFEKATGANEVHGMLMHDRKPGEGCQVLIKGIAKPNATLAADGAIIAAGAGIALKAGKLAAPASSGTSHSFGTALSAGAANSADHMLIFFNTLIPRGDAK